MVDTVTAEVRSRMMAAIRSKDTAPEMVIRRALHAMGFRYRIHKRVGSARPDLLFPRFNAAVFVHGCFWHGHVGCRYSRIPESNVEYWSSKIAGNMRRDATNEDCLAENGWRVAVIWECALKDIGIAVVSAKLADWLPNRERRFELSSDVTASSTSGNGPRFHGHKDSS